jgi:hypothetical protein
MVLSHHWHTIGVFSSRQAARKALNSLTYAGFPMKQVSLVAHDSVWGQQHSGDRVMDELVRQARQGATTGSVEGLMTGNKIGSVAGLLLGLSTLAIPGIGQMILVGSAGTIAAYVLSSGVVGVVAGGLIGALVGLGVTEAQIKGEGRIASGDYLLMVEGTGDEISRAESILTSVNAR